ncbi:MAG TPA: carboxypeptidase regulatory-like domain-containing protein [Planctomycetes bacterium]|nr:carboxypeptidase regulatory-like domain-containing protein [Planctomycetota bacterium]HIL37110.1 carboxypeptidase regulatory-like domain-containing protein [Planctomycetota bacterium]
MSRLLIVLFFCAALVGAILLTMGGQEPLPEPQELSPQQETATKDEPDEALVMQREDARGFEPASLEVITKNPQGVQLADATVSLSRTDLGVNLTGSGVHTFPSLTAGTWELLVQHPEFIDDLSTVVLEPGSKEHLVVQLYPDLRISGTVTDRFGRNQVGQFIWFLRDGELYPKRLKRASKLLGGQVATNGEFVAHIPADVPLRMVVGLPGKPRWQDENLTMLQAGDPQHLELVISGTTRTRVVVQGAKPPRNERQSMFSIAIQSGRKAKAGRDDTQFLETYDAQTRRQIALAKQQETLKSIRDEAREKGGLPFEEFAEDPDGNPQANQGPRGGRLRRMRQERLKQRKERQAAGLPPEPRQPRQARQDTAPAQAPSNKVSDGLLWQTLRQETCPLTGELTFHNLPVDQDLRLRVVRRIESLDSEAIFRALPDVTQVLALSMPEPRSSRPPDSITPTLFFSTRLESLPSEAPKAGATWSE